MDHRRFTWGGVYPVGCPEGPSRRRAACLVEGDDPAAAVTVGFLQLVEHAVLDARGEPVEELRVDGVDHRPWVETVEREVRIPELPGRTATVGVGVGEDEELYEAGLPAGHLVRRRETLHGTVEAWLETIQPGLQRVEVSVANRLDWDSGPFEETLMHTLCSTNVEVRVDDGAIVDAGASARTALL